MEKQPEAFSKCSAQPISIARRTKESSALFTRSNRPNMLEDKIDRIELFRSLGVRVMQLTYNHRTPLGCGCPTATRTA